MKAIYNDRIYIRKSDMSLDLKRAIYKKFKFEIDKFRDYEIVSLLKSDEDYLILPPNKSYFTEVCKDLGVTIEWEDLSALPINKITPKVSMEFRTEPINQVEIHNQLKDFGYNALLNIATGGGKSTMAIKIANILNTPSLFTAAQTSYIKNYIKELQNFVEDWQEHFVEVNTEWLKDPVIKPYMVASLQALQNPKILEALSGKIGLLIGDEIHTGVTSDIRRETLYSLNPRHRIYLSGTYEHRAHGFAEAALSSNIVEVDGVLGYDIHIQPISIAVGMGYNEYWETDSYHKRKEAIYQNVDLDHYTARFCDWLVKKGRGVLVYADNVEFQENVAKELREEFKVKVAILNSNTKKTEVEQILTDYDNGLYDVIIGGVAVTTGISLYRLSAVVDTSISIGGNTLKQLIGRLKRKKDEICSKDKLFIKFVYDGCTERNWKTKALPVIKKMEYCKVAKMRTPHTSIIEQVFDRNIVK